MVLGLGLRLSERNGVAHRLVDLLVDLLAYLRRNRRKSALLQLGLLQLGLLHAVADAIAAISLEGGIAYSAGAAVVVRLLTCLLPGLLTVDLSGLKRHLNICGILAGVGGIILKPLERAVQGKGEKRAHQRTNPVDPVVARELGNYSRTERSSGVDASARVVGQGNVGNEDGQTNGNWGQEGRAVLLNGEEVHGQDKLGCQEHLQEDTLDLARSVAKGIVDGKRPRKHAVDCTGSSDGGDELNRHNHGSSQGLDGADQYQTKGNLFRSISIFAHEKSTTILL